MKIAISGASSVGKTTLLNEIEKNNKGFEDHILIREVVRSLIAKGVKINKGADHESQCRILQAHYDNILSHKNFITDRCAIDAFVYATWDYLNGNYSFKEHKEHEQIFLSCLSSYTHFFYLKPEFAIVPDGVRDIDVNYQSEIHRLFEVVFEKYSIKPAYLTGSVEARFEWFLVNITNSKLI